MRLDVINLIIDLVVGEWYNLVSAQQIHVCVYTHLTHMYFLLTIYRVNTNFETFFRNKLRRKKRNILRVSVDMQMISELLSCTH